MLRVACASLLLLALLAGCSYPDNGSPTTTPPASAAFTPCKANADGSYGITAAHTTLLMRTGIGNMTIELYDDKAPVTTQNFLTYVNEGFYTNQPFYRIVPGFVSQGGGERTGGTGKHPAICDEAKANGIHNAKYTLAMARTSNPTSATTEFFINAADNVAPNQSNLDPGGVSPDGYAVFGIVKVGRDVADRLNTSDGKVKILGITVVEQ